jgi:hypothetical protein
MKRHALVLAALLLAWEATKGQAQTPDSYPFQVTAIDNWTGKPISPIGANTEKEAQEIVEYLKSLKDEYNVGFRDIKYERTRRGSPLVKLPRVDPGLYKVMDRHNDLLKKNGPSEDEDLERLRAARRSALTAIGRLKAKEGSIAQAQLDAANRLIDAYNQRRKDFISRYGRDYGMGELSRLTRDEGPTKPPVAKRRANKPRPVQFPSVAGTRWSDGSGMTYILNEGGTGTATSRGSRRVRISWSQNHDQVTVTYRSGATFSFIRKGDRLIGVGRAADISLVLVR